MSALSLRVSELLVNLGIDGLRELPSHTNSSVSYTSNGGVIEFLIDTSGEVVVVGGLEYGAIIPAELSFYVAGMVDADRQSQMLNETLGSARVYPSHFLDVVQYLRKYRTLDELLEAFGELRKGDALRRLREYRGLKGEAW